MILNRINNVILFFIDGEINELDWMLELFGFFLMVKILNGMGFKILFFGVLIVSLVVILVFSGLLLS